MRGGVRVEVRSHMRFCKGRVCASARNLCEFSAVLSHRHSLTGAGAQGNATRFSQIQQSRYRASGDDEVVCAICPLTTVPNQARPAALIRCSTHTVLATTS